MAATPVAVPVKRQRRRSVIPEGTNWAAAIVFLVPALLLLIVFLVFPTVYTILLSFNRGRAGEFSNWVGLSNYEQLLFRDPAFLRLGIPPSGALWNNVLWVIFYVSLVLLLGLIIAVLATRVRYEAFIKAVVFVPMAIAATALAIIWTFVYSPNANQGLLNAILGAIGASPIAFLGNPSVVNYALIAVGVWGSVGFATVILSAALKGIPSEIIEAARVDGANERQIFRRIIVPMVSLPMSVLAVTLVVNVIKLFDLVFVMTAGGPGVSSRVMAFTMYAEAFSGGLFGKGAAVVVIMLVLLTPIMVYNIRRFRTGAVV